MDNYNYDIGFRDHYGGLVRESNDFTQQSIKQY